MLKNYIKIAWKVLLRRPFYTFITLFGITFTLTILMVIASFVDHLIGNHYPEVYRDRSVYISRVKQQDSLRQSTRISPLTFQFLNQYAASLKSADKVGIVNMFNQANAYSNGQRIKLGVKYANPEFWEVARFDFLEGKPFNEAHIRNRDNVVVISDKLRGQYFGGNGPATGKTIEIDNERFRVIGVVKSVPSTRPMTSGDAYFPYTVSKSNYEKQGYVGSFVVLATAKTRAGRKAIEEEYAEIIRRIPKPLEEDGMRVYHMESEALPYLESWLSNFIEEDGVPKFYSALFLFALIILLLPTINLVNLNISRIVERSSEISIRKAFGAPSSTILWQFVVENMFIALVGGVIALAFTLVVLTMINQSGWIPNAVLVINFPVFLVSILLCLLFGFISGVYPAWRMSRMPVADALRAG